MLDDSSFAEPRLRVLAITPTLAPGGAEQQLVTLIRHSQRLKFVSIIGLGGVGGFHGLRLSSMVNVPIWVADIHTGDSRESAVIRQVKARMEQGAAFDIIIHWGFQELDLAFTGVPVVHASHASATEDINEYHAQYYRLLGKSKSNFLCCVSKSGVEIFDPKQRSRTKVQVIHNGGDIERTRQVNGRNWQRAMWDLNDEHRVMLFLGRLFPGKGAEVAIDALPHLPDSYRLVMYGWGDSREELVMRAKANAPGRVIFPQPQLAGLGDVYAACDVSVLPSRSEAFPLVMVEAWQAGIPLVCSEFQTLMECEEAYNDGRPLAWHVPCPPSAKDLAAAVQEVDEADPRIMEAQQVGMSQLSASAMVGRWENYLFECMHEWLKRAQRGGVQWV